MPYEEVDSNLQGEKEIGDTKQDLGKYHECQTSSRSNGNIIPAYQNDSNSALKEEARALAHGNRGMYFRNKLLTKYT